MGACPLLGIFSKCLVPVYIQLIIWVICHIHLLLYPSNRLILNLIDIWPFPVTLGYRDVAGVRQSHWVTAALQRAWGNQGTVHMAPSGCGDKSSFHERGKQWKVCAKELITRCICVLFWRGEEGYSSTGPQGKAGAWMDGYKHGWIGHVMGNWNQKAKQLCLLFWHGVLLTVYMWVTNTKCYNDFSRPALTLSLIYDPLLFFLRDLPVTILPCLDVDNQGLQLDLKGRVGKFKKPARDR